MLHFIVSALLPKECGCIDSVLSSYNKDQKVNMTGIYILEDVENYRQYLLAMGIPSDVADNLRNIK